tara:strand:- start:187 stop:399 length:213 start_codon:yes stop_codon:yes gene_type:complete
MNKIITLQIRDSGEDYTVYLCKTYEIAERIIRDWFAEYCTDNPSLEELEEYLFVKDIGYWEITEQEVICE